MEDDEAERVDQEERYENRLKMARRVQQEEFDVEKEEARLRELYGRQERFKSFDPEGASVARVPQQFLLPSVRDPKLWLVKCRPGKEREVVSSVMKKFMSRHNMGNPLQISAIVARDALKGYIYVEAFKLPHVQEVLSFLSIR